jgi:excisionase family DNA binding protein
MSDPTLTPTLRFLEPDDIAEVLGVSRPIVMRMLRSGQIPAIKAGRFWRIPPSALAVLDRKAQKRSDL